MNSGGRSVTGITFPFGLMEQRGEFGLKSYFFSPPLIAPDLLAASVATVTIRYRLATILFVNSTVSQCSHLVCGTTDFRSPTLMLLRWMSHPDRHYVGGALTSDTVVTKDFFGRRNHFFPGKDQSFPRPTRAFNRDELLVGITDDFN
jgi:hypothetical protein